MASKDEKLFLSFYGDGPYWEDFLHLLAYPSNCNYVWPFRYSDRHLQNELASKLQTDAGVSETTGSWVVIGTRFQNANNPGKFYPIRMCKIRRVEYEANIFSFHLILGEHFDFNHYSTFTQASINVGSGSSKLAFLDSNYDDLPSTCAADDEGDNWNAFARLVSKASQVNQNASSGLWLRILSVEQGKKSVQFGRLKHFLPLYDRKKLTEHGLFFYPGDALRVKYAHYVPSLEQKNTTLGGIDIDVSSDTPSIDVSTVSSRPIGNYGIQEFTFMATSPTTIAHKLSFNFEDKVLTAQNGRSQVYTSQYEVPIFSRWSIFNWIRTSLFPVAALFLSLTVLGLAGIFESHLPTVIAGEGSFSQIWENWTFIIVIVIAAAAATIAIPFFKSTRK